MIGEATVQRDKAVVLTTIGDDPSATDRQLGADTHEGSVAHTQPNTTKHRWLLLRVDLAIIPLVSLLYLFCFIDRSNIGNARLAGLESELRLHGYDFNIALTCFSITYAVFEIPAAILCKYVGPGWFIPFTTIAFGLLSASTGLVQTRSQLFAVRSLLGLFEAGMFPGIAYYLSRWYRRAELGFRLSFYIATAPLAGAFGGLLASVILELDHFGTLRGWRMLFAIEGLVSVFCGLLGLVFLTDGPHTARWLTAEERDFLTRRVMADRETSSSSSSSSHLLDKMDAVKLRRGIVNPVALGTGVMFFMNAFTVQGLSFFLPTIVATIYPDASVTRQQLYTAPPFTVAVLSTLSFSGLSWWLDRRQMILILTTVPILVGYSLFLATLDPTIRYVATFLVASTCTVSGSLTNAQVSANVVSDTSRSAAIGVNTFLGTLGGILATWAFLPFDAPYYAIGNGLNLATTSVWLLVGIALFLWMRHDNKRRDSVSISESSIDLSPSEIEDLEWKHPAFRWKP